MVGRGAVERAVVEEDLPGGIGVGLERGVKEVLVGGAELRNLVERGVAHGDDHKVAVAHHKVALAVGQRELGEVGHDNLVVVAVGGHEGDLRESVGALLEPEVPLRLHGANLDGVAREEHEVCALLEELVGRGLPGVIGGGAGVSNDREGEGGGAALLRRRHEALHLAPATLATDLVVVGLGGLEVAHVDLVGAAVGQARVGEVVAVVLSVESIGRLTEPDD